MVAFHLAFAVTDLAATRRFYLDVLGCGLGREDRENDPPRWIDFDFYGHQISAHLVDGALAPSETNPVDGDAVPARHFGAVLSWEGWHILSERLRASGIPFLIEPHIRFAGQVGEQATFFLRDPSGNALEFKSFKDPSRLFARG
jgi:extradiol dioxygenase family protein